MTELPTGVLAPIIATSMVTHGILFSRFFGLLLGLRVVNFCMIGPSFWHFEQDSRIHADGQLLTSLERRVDRSSTEQAERSTKFREFARALKNRTTLVGALFIFAYQGAEVSISGWVISFLITVRHGDPARVGYVTAGFWVGIADYCSLQCAH